MDSVPQKSKSAPHSFVDGIEGKVCGAGRKHHRKGSRNCTTWRPLTDFVQNNSYEDGLAGTCVHCERERKHAQKATPRETALAPVRTDTVTVMEREFTVGWHEDALYWPVKPFVEAAGMDRNAQFQRINRDTILRSGRCILHLPDPNGKRQETLCLPWSMWHTFWFGTHAPQAEQFRAEAAKALELVFGHTAGEVLAPTSVEQKLISAAQQIAPTGLMGVQSFSIEQVNELIRAHTAPLHMMIEEQHMMLEEQGELQRQMARRMGVLTDIKQDTAALLGAVGNATIIRTEEVWKAQIYICRLVNPAYLTLTRREYRNIPANAELLFIGKTGPHGNIQDIRIADYGGKWDVLPEDYEVLATFGTDAPADVENTLLQNPLPNCIRLVRTKTSQRSKTFLAATHGAEQQYRKFANKHYTYQTARLLLSGFEGQLDLFGGAS